MPKKIDAYECQYCRKLYRTLPWVKRHERTCFKNPYRVPKRGELAKEWMYGYFKCYHGKIPPWLPPRPGYIFSGKYWIEVMGYKPSMDLDTDEYLSLYVHEEEWPYVEPYWNETGGKLNEFPLNISDDDWSRWFVFVLSFECYEWPDDICAPPTELQAVHQRTEQAA